MLTFSVNIMVNGTFSGDLWGKFSHMDWSHGSSACMSCIIHWINRVQCRAVPLVEHYISLAV